MTSSNGNIFRVTGPLWGEYTGYRWIPLTKASDVELWCFLWSAPEQTVEQTIPMPVIWDAIALIMMSLYCLFAAHKEPVMRKICSYYDIFTGFPLHSRLMLSSEKERHNLLSTMCANVVVPSVTMSFASTATVLIRVSGSVSATRIHSTITAISVSENVTIRSLWPRPIKHDIA